MRDDIVVSSFNDLIAVLSQQLDQFPAMMTFARNAGFDTGTIFHSTKLVKLGELIPRNVELIAESIAFMDMANLLAINVGYLPGDLKDQIRDLIVSSRSAKNMSVVLGIDVVGDYLFDSAEVGNEILSDNLVIISLFFFTLIAKVTNSDL